MAGWSRCGNGRMFPHYPATVAAVLAVEPEPRLRAAARAAADPDPDPGRPARARHRGPAMIRPAA